MELNENMVATLLKQANAASTRRRNGNMNPRPYFKNPILISSLKGPKPIPMDNLMWKSRRTNFPSHLNIKNVQSMGGEGEGEESEDAEDDDPIISVVIGYGEGIKTPILYSNNGYAAAPHIIEV
ncbi:hypothetical protein H4219_001015 [Mycoemilia scoparia]|uniref:Uncharacterized protein n=1 Tax=Mycoemilia scoparia TaxID=417184 RepID=A0A9W8A1G7_9FUNG|nr:hypothetical protein H4219_001015 [Mycoemilia scoparia]